MKVTKLSNKQLLIEFPTRKEMNLTCFRMSEFSEGYEELRQYYTPDVFIDKWSDEDGKITYWEYWQGHNITKKKIIEFSDVFSHGYYTTSLFGKQPDLVQIRDINLHLSKREIEVIFLLHQIDIDGYVIFIEEGDLITLRHELSHSYYFLYDTYKQRANAILNTLGDDISNRIKKGLIDMKYSEDVLQDEMQAYLTAYDQEEFQELFPNIKLSEILDVTILLNNLYNEMKM